MAFVNLNPGTLLAPVPVVLVSCARKGEKPNAVTIAWAGTVNSDPPMVSVSVRPERYSHDIIEETGEFVVNFCGQDNLKATDWCGVKSGRDFDKFKECGMTAVPVPGMDCAPAIGECPLYLACKVKRVERLGSHDMYIGEIVSVGIQDTLLDETGRIDFNKANLVAYNHGAYYALGEALGFFGYSVAAPDVLERRMAQLK